MKEIVFILLLLVIIPFVSSAPPQELNQQSAYNCSNETMPLEIKIIELNKVIDNLKINQSYYQNLSEYYKFIYESKEVNVTHGELIQIINILNNYQWNLNQTNKTLNDIKNKFSVFTFEVGISILGVTGISVGLIELTLWYMKKRRKRHEPNP